MIRYRRSPNHKLCRPRIRKRYMNDLPGTYREIISIWIPGGVWSQGWNLKKLTEGHHKEWNMRFNLTQHGKTYQVQTQGGLTDWELFLNFVGGGAWPFLVGGVICLVNSVNERDLNLLNSNIYLDNLLPIVGGLLLRGTLHVKSEWKFEAKTGLWCP